MERGLGRVGSLEERTHTAFRFFDSEAVLGFRVESVVTLGGEEIFFSDVFEADFHVGFEDGLEAFDKVRSI